MERDEESRRARERGMRVRPQADPVPQGLQRYSTDRGCYSGGGGPVVTPSDIARFRYPPLSENPKLDGMTTGRPNGPARSGPIRSDPVRLAPGPAPLQAPPPNALAAGETRLSTGARVKAAPRSPPGQGASPPP